MNRNALKQIIKNQVLEYIKLKEVSTPSDVASLNKAQQSAKTVNYKAKSINTVNEFPGAFENWFKTLGFEPGKVSKSVLRASVEKVLTNLGYK